jgi:hypothetical protein
MTDEPRHHARADMAWNRSPRCGAKTRSGTPCLRPAANGKGRCQLHGGAKGSGGPRGARNGNYRHGRRTREAEAERQALRALLRELRGDE